MGILSRFAAARLLVILAPVAFVLLLPIGAVAGGFTVAPIKVFIKGAKKSAVIKVTNDGGQEAGLQMSAVAWGQDEAGGNIFEETKDIIFFPKITRVKAGETKTIRIGYQGAAGANEKTYRIFIQELASAKSALDSLGFTVKMTVPIFIAPTRAVAERSLDSVALAGGRALIEFKNSGNAHTVVNKVSAIGLDKGGKEVFRTEIGGWYVLAGLVRAYALDVPLEECLKASAVKGVVVVGESVLERQVEVDSSQCRSDK